MLRTIKKVSVVLGLFDREHAEWGVRDVAAKVKIPKSSAHDLLSSLSEAGLLAKTKEGRYRLGWRLMALSEMMLSTDDLRREARPVMEDLAARFDETVHLAVLDDTRVVYLDKVEAGQGVHLELTSPGARLFAHCSAVGKVLLAHQSEMQVERIVRTEGLRPFTPNTITTPRKLKETLLTVGTHGLAYDLEEVMPNLCCVASLIRDDSGSVVAAMSMSAPKDRFRRLQEEFQRAVLRSSRAISQRLGYYGT
jgi:DNA-binding IclR family transcriptional regulator